MKISVTKKGAGKTLAGQRRTFGEVIEVGNRTARVLCGVGFATRELPKKKKAKKKVSKKTYKTRDLTAEKPDAQTK